MRRRIQEHFLGSGSKFFGMGPIFPDKSQHFMPWKYILHNYNLKIRRGLVVEPRTSPLPHLNLPI